MWILKLYTVVIVVCLIMLSSIHYVMNRPIAIQQVSGLTECLKEEVSIQHEGMEEWRTHHKYSTKTGFQDLYSNCKQPRVPNILHWTSFYGRSATFRFHHFISATSVLGSVADLRQAQLAMRQRCDERCDRVASVADMTTLGGG